LREPGQEQKETIYTGTRAAAAGGYTSICCIPNTNPVIDSQTGVKFILSRAQTDAVVNVFPYAAVTRGQQGEEITEFGDLLQAGAVGFTDDGHPIMNNNVMRRALDYARNFDTLILDHCEDAHIADGGHIREGEISLRVGVKGWPSLAESLHVSRDAQLCEYTNSRIHIFHVSSRTSVREIRHARALGVRISGEASPHHLTLTTDAVANFDTKAKCNPPIGTEDDRQALIEGVKDGTLEVIATDHAPHTTIEKELMFTDAPNGLIGMETAWPVLNTYLIREGILDLPLVIATMTCNPARLLRLEKGTLSEGADADVTVLDPDLVWTVDPEKFLSKARNCPYNGRELTGRAILTMVGGRMIYRDGEIVV
jgi:dihydroorotase